MTSSTIDDSTTYAACGDWTPAERHWALCRSFPSLRQHIPATRGFVKLSLLTRLASSTTDDDPTHHAASFAEDLMPKHPGRPTPDLHFNVVVAFRVWDAAHREAFMRWARDPFWLR